jgi:hypothetical protein
MDCTEALHPTLRPSCKLSTARRPANNSSLVQNCLEVALLDLRCELCRLHLPHDNNGRVLKPRRTLLHREVETGTADASVAPLCGLNYSVNVNAVLLLIKICDAD